MLEVTEQSTDSCVVVHVDGKITGEQYAQMRSAVEERLAARAGIDLVIDMRGFEAYADFDAVVQDFRFGFGDYMKLNRAAFVCDQRWVELLVAVFRPLTPVEERTFCEDNLEEAIAWACARPQEECE